MNPLNLNEVNTFVNENITRFHESRLKIIQGLNLNKLLQKNPYSSKQKT